MSWYSLGKLRLLAKWQFLWGFFVCKWSVCSWGQKSSIFCDPLPRLSDSHSDWFCGVKKTHSGVIWFQGLFKNNKILKIVALSRKEQREKPHCSCSPKDKVNVFFLILCYIIAFAGGDGFVSFSCSFLCSILLSVILLHNNLYSNVYIAWEIPSKARKYEQYMCTHTHTIMNTQTVQAKWIIYQHVTVHRQARAPWHNTLTKECRVTDCSFLTPVSEY